jgi:hypothetical protein
MILARPAFTRRQYTPRANLSPVLISGLAQATADDDHRRRQLAGGRRGIQGPDLMARSEACGRFATEIILIHSHGQLGEHPSG